METSPLLQLKKKIGKGDAQWESNRGCGPEHEDVFNKEEEGGKIGASKLIYSRLSSLKKAAEVREGRGPGAMENRRGSCSP